MGDWLPHTGRIVSATDPSFTIPETNRLLYQLVKTQADLAAEQAAAARRERWMLGLAAGALLAGLGSIVVGVLAI